MTKLEKDIEAALVRKVKQRGGQCLKWICPGQAGVPDRIVLLPGGRIIFVELKRPKGGKLSKLQDYWGDKLQNLGFEWRIIWDDHDLDDLEASIDEEVQR